MKKLIGVKSIHITSILILLNFIFLSSSTYAEGIYGGTVIIEEAPSGDKLDKNNEDLIDEETIEIKKPAEKPADNGEIVVDVEIIEIQKPADSNEKPVDEETIEIKKPAKKTGQISSEDMKVINSRLNKMNFKMKFMIRAMVRAY